MKFKIIQLPDWIAYILVGLTKVVDVVMSWAIVRTGNFSELNPIYPYVGWIGLFIIGLGGTFLILYLFSKVFSKRTYSNVLWFFAGLGFVPIFSNIVQLGWYPL